MSIKSAGEDLLIPGAIGLTAYAVGDLCQAALGSEPVTAMLSQAGQELIGTMAVTRAMAEAAAASSGSQNMSVQMIVGQSRILADATQASLSPHVAFLGQIGQVMQVAKASGLQSAFWAGSVETAVSFVLSLTRKEEKPFVVSLMEGALRGGTIGLIAGATTNRTPVSLAAGAVIGMGSGIVGSAVGTVAGYVFRSFGKTLGCDRKSVSAGIGTVVVLTGAHAYPLEAAYGGAVVASGASLSSYIWSKLFK